MKQTITLLFFLFVSVVAVTQNEIKLRFDGLYQTELIEEDRTFLRFYEDGTVLYVTSSGEMGDLVKWFRKDYHSRPKDVRGKFILKDDDVEFNIFSEDGKVVYKGRIKNNSTIIFNTKSFINGKISIKEFYFIKF